MADIHKFGLVASPNGVFGLSECSDLTIKCGSDEYKLHHAIACERSAFFAAACDGNIKVREILPAWPVLMSYASLIFQYVSREDPLLISITRKDRRSRLPCKRMTPLLSIGC